MVAENVCVEGKDDKPGSFQLSSEPSRCLTGIKLRHRSGKMVCSLILGVVLADGVWGCSLMDRPLNMLVTDVDNNVLLPEHQSTQYANNAGFYYDLPGYNPTSPELTLLASPNMSLHLQPGNSTLKIWYGEDLKNKDDGDNDKGICVDVFSRNKSCSGKRSESDMF